LGKGGSGKKGLGPEKVEEREDFVNQGRRIKEKVGSTARSLKSKVWERGDANPLVM